MTKEIELLQNTDLQTIFDNDLDPILSQIKKEVDSFVPDVATAKGRSDIKSLAYKVVRSKTAIDGAGKELNAEIKAKAKLIDSSRKKARDFLDNLAKEVRLPLTEYEEMEAKKVHQQLIDKLHIEAISENELFDKAKLIEAKEKEVLEQQQKMKAEQDRIDRDNKIREEEKARVELAKIQAIDAEKRALKAEKDKIELVKQQKERDNQLIIEQKERQKQNLIDEENRKKQALIDRENAVRAEKQRLEDEEKARQAKALADKEHVRKVNKNALNCFILEGIEESIAKKVITLIVQEKVSNIKICY